MDKIRTIFKKLLLVALLALAGLVLTTCDLTQPGLGEKVDVTPPVIRVVSPSANSYVRGTFTVKGTVADDRTVKYVRVSYTNINKQIRVVDAEVNDKSWSVHISSGTTNPNDIGTGRQKISFETSDDAGKTDSGEYFLNVDNNAPVVFLSSPTNLGTDLYNSELEVRYEVYEDSEIDRIEFSIWQGSTQTQPQTQKGVSKSTGILNGSVVFEGLPSISLIDGGTYEVRVEAYDKAGNITRNYWHNNALSKELKTGVNMPSYVSISRSMLGLDDAPAINTWFLNTYTDTMYGPDATQENNKYVTFKYTDKLIPTIQFNTPGRSSIAENILGLSIDLEFTVGKPKSETTYKDIDVPLVVLYKINDVGAVESTIPITLEPTVDPSTPLDYDSDHLTNSTFAKVSFVVRNKNSLGIKRLANSGKYRLEVSVKASSPENKYPPNTKTVEFMLSQGVPELSADSGLMSYASAPVSSSGTIQSSDAIVSMSFVLSRYNGSTLNEEIAAYDASAIPASTMTLGAGLWALKTPYSFNHGPGLYTFKVSAVSSGNSIGETSFNIQYDTELPASIFGELVPRVGEKTVNGVFTLNVTNTDNIGLDKAWWAISPTPPALASWTPVTGSITSVAFVLDTTTAGNNIKVNTIPKSQGIADNSSSKIWVRTQDLAGNIKDSSKEFTVSQASDIPTVEYSNVDISAVANTSADARKNLFESSAIIRFAISDDDMVQGSSIALQIDDGIWAPIASPPANSKNVNGIAWDLSPSGSPLADGIHKFSLRFSDTDKAGLGSTQTVSGPYYFMIDRTNPVLTVTSPAIPSTFTKSAINLAGTASDANGIATVEITYRKDNASPESLVVTGKESWTASIPAPESGTYEFTITALDSNNRGASSTRTIIVDKLSPTVEITSFSTIAASGNRVNGTVSFSALSADANGLEGTKYFVTSTGVEPAYTASEGGPVVKVLPGLSINTVADLSDLGDYWLWVVSRDKAGNDGAASLSFRVDQSTDLPVLSFDGLDSAVVLESNAGTNLKVTGTSLGGTIVDDDGLPNNATISIWKAAGAVDSNGDDVIVVNAVNLPLTGTEKSKTFTYNLGTLASDGAYRFVISVSDTGPLNKSNAAMAPLWFAYDTAAPTLVFNPNDSVAIPLAGSYRSSNFTVQGTVSDANGISKVEFSLNGGTDWENLGLTALPGENKAWSRTITASSTNGSHNLVLKATDKYGRTSQNSGISVVVDTVQPNILISPLGALYYADIQLAVSGTASDALSGLAGISYSLVGATGPWLPVNGSSSWFKNDIPTDLLAETSSATVWVRALDQAGNSQVSSANFVIDHNAPVLVVDSAFDVSVYKNNLFTISGTVSDYHLGASPLTITAKKNGVVHNLTQALVYSPETHPIPGTWSRDINVDGSGNYEITITAIDSLNRQTIERRTIIVDQTAPTVEITSLNAFAQGNKVNGTIDYNAVASDSNGIAGLRYYVSTSTDTPSYGAVEGGVIVRAQGSATSLNTNTLADLGDYYLHAVAQDKAGNETGAMLAFRVDQSTDLPVLSFDGLNTTVVLESNAGTNLKVSASTLAGTISDDDGLPANGTISIWKAAGTVDSNGDDSPVVVAASLPLTGTSKSKNFSYDLGTLASDGAYRFVISVSDTGPLNKSNAAMTPVWFAYDTAAPTVIFDATDSLAIPLAGSYRNGNFTVQGTVSDANGISGVLFSLNGGTDWENLGLTALPAENKAWSRTITASSTNGSHNLVLKATDKYGRTSQSPGLAVVVDTVIPTMAVSLATDTALSGWLGNPAVSLAGTSGDGLSGVQVVEYSLDGSTWSPLSGTVSWSGVAAFSAGTNSLKFRARDRAGNESAILNRSVTVDTSAPVLNMISPADLVKVNGQFDLALSLGASDTSNGTLNGSAVSTVRVKLNSNDFSTGTIYNALLDSGTIHSGTWSATIPAAALLALNNGQRTVFIEGRDGVGLSTITSFPVLIDKIAPSLSSTSPANNSTINKTVIISGNASDTQGLDSLNPVTVAIRNVGTSSWEILSGTNGSTVWDQAIDTASYESATYDSNLGLAGVQIQISVTALDEAGNTNNLSRIFTIDQNTDRPVISLSNIDVATLSTLKLSRTIYGTLTDDDGTVNSFQLSLDGSTWTTRAVNGGSWSYDIPGGEGDGSKTLYFKVSDAQNTAFASNNVPILERPRVLVNAVPTYSDIPVAFKLDTVSPEIEAGIMVDNNAPLDFGDSTALITNMPFGGSSGQFKIRVLAKDANGIQSVSLSVPGVAGSPFTAFDAGADAILTDYTRFETGVIDVSAASGGSVNVLVTVTDQSGLQSTATRTIIIDNNLPDYSFLSPQTSDIVNGNVEIKGLASDSGSGLLSVEYKLGYNHALRSWQAVSASLFSWQINLVNANRSDIYAGQYIGGINTTSDVITMAGHGFTNGEKAWVSTALGTSSPDLPGGLSYSSDYYIVNATGNTFQLSASAGGPAIDITSSGSPLRISNASKDVDNDGIWELPILVRATDKAGNVRSGTELDYLLKIDPSGDIPRVTVVYPAPNAVLGGNIRVFGSSVDDDGIQGIYMQITDQVDGSSNPLYSVANVYGGTDWYNSGNGRLVSGTVSWNQTINSSNEFNPAGEGTRTIYYRLKARDIYGLDGPWTPSLRIDVDKNVPKIGSTDPLMLVKGAATQTYIADTWLTGAWNLTGSIEDESGIDSITITGSVNGSLAANPAWFSPVADFGNGNSGYRFTIPLTTLASDGNISFTITALDNSTPQQSSGTQVSVNADNTAPVAAAYSGSVPIVQSNNSYELKSSLTESGSGFGRVAFYLVRRERGAGSANDRLYDPQIGNSPVLLSSLSLENGLYYLSRTGASRGSETALIDTGLIGNSHVRKGGLVKIGGLDRVIASFNSVTGEIVWSGAVPLGETSYKLAYAQIIDNLTVETPVYAGSTMTGITNDDGDGMVEAVERSGGLYNWSANINSKNIPDGPIEIRWVSFDKAGNYVEGFSGGDSYVETSVANNRPLLASAILGTDLNGDGTIAANEKVPAYSALDGNGKEQQFASLGSSAFIAKDQTSIEISVVGGNGQLQYVLSHAGANSIIGDGDDIQIHSLSNLRSTEISGVLPVIATNANLSTVGEGSRTLRFAIWDSTEESVPGIDSLKATLDVPMMVRLLDAVRPKSVIRPFYWNSATDNSLFDNSKSNGHIDIGLNALGDTDPKVSGKISIRGTAFDDQRIKALYGYIGNGTNDTGKYAFTGADTTVVDGGLTYSSLATFTAGVWALEDNLVSNGWKFAIEGESFDQSGHRIDWRLDWDSAGIPGVAATNRTVKLLTRDKSNNDSLAALSAGFTLTGSGSRPSTMALSLTHNVAIAQGQLVLLTSADQSYMARIASYDGAGKITLDRSIPVQFTDYTIYLDDHNNPVYQIDIVPYINGLSRATTFNTIRSRQGYYVFRRSESMKVTGFNIWNTTADTAVFNGATVTLNGTNAPGASSSQFTITVPLAARSGNLALSVNSVSSINNLNNNPSPWNSEASAAPHIDGSGLWTDDRKLHIWQSDDTQTGTNRGYFSGSIDPEYPAMTIDTTGVLYGSWSNYATSSTNYIGNNVNYGVLTNRIAASYDPLEQTDIAYGNRPGVIYNANTYGNGIWNLDGAGGVVVWDSQANAATSVTTGSGYEVEYLYHDRRLMQFTNQRIAYNGNNIHVSYYDTETKALKYWYNPSNTNNAYTPSWINIDGGFDAHDGAHTEVFGLNENVTGGATITNIYVNHGDTVAAGANIMRDSNNRLYTAPVAGVVDIPLTVGTRLSGTNVTNSQSLIFTIRTSTNRVVDAAGSTRSAAAGEFSAVDVNSNGYPVIAYYDISNKTVKLARASAVNPSAPQWTLQTVMAVDDPNLLYSGKYISMKIDSDGYLHMVFFRNSTGDLVYLKSTNNPSNGTTAYTFGKSVVVDSIGSVGVWADLSIKAVAGTVAGGNDLPYISYLDSSLTNTFDGVKMAYYDPALEQLGTDTAGQPDTDDGWEYMNAALNFEVESVRTSIENDTGTNFWGQAIGYSSTDYFRIGYYVD